MDERRMLAVVSLALALHCVDAMFFHTPSSVVLQASKAENNTDFGFSMAYMKNENTLIVGAPRADKIGEIFSCDLQDAAAVEKIPCSKQYMGIDPAEYNTERFPDQNFHLGATVLAHKDYSFTCAPLWTTKVNGYDASGHMIELSDTFGTCFIKTDSDTVRFQGLLEQYQRPKKKKRNLIDRFNGGTGWSTLMDEENDLLLMTKTTTLLSGDIFYLRASKPNADVKSLNDNKPTRVYLTNNFNIGFGIAAGKFFTKDKDSVPGKGHNCDRVNCYAISVLPKNMEGRILFLKYHRGSLTMLAPPKVNRNVFIELNNKAVGSMFGSTMSAADLNLDGLDELLVGAPSQTEDECVECGALHIYLSGDVKTINEPKRLRSISGNAEYGRFGTAITAKDLDGDGKPELVVSAPYKDHKNGAIYILSGYEIYNTLMKTQDYKSIQLSDLKLTQRIQKKSYRALGFSLQFVTDVDENGCDDLAVGSPGSSTVLLFKCVQKVNVTLSSHLAGEQKIKVSDKNFTVEVCAKVILPLELPADIAGNITVESSIVRGAAIVLQPNIVIDMSCYSCLRVRTLCKNVTVEMIGKDPADYILTSKAVLQNYYLTDPNMTEFNASWVEASPHSKMEASLEVSRRCQGDDICEPDLSVNITWSGGERYLLGSTANETAKITVYNNGNDTYLSCIWLRMTGAPLSQVDCESYQEGYKCYLPKPLKRESSYDIILKMNMTKPTNEAEALLLEVYTYENCNQESVNRSGILKIPLDLPSEGIFSVGDVHRLNITDKQILDNAIVYDHHEYPIRNNGSITWKAVNFTVSMQKTGTHKYINSLKITAADFGDCDISSLSDSSVIVYHCILNLPPNATKTVIGTTEIYAGRLTGYVTGDELNLTSETKLVLSARIPVIISLSNTMITIQKEITWASQKWLIALIAAIVALILLAILTIILYKCGFFRRKQKQVLLVAKESVRRKSIRRDTHASARDGPSEGLQMDVDDDCPFGDARPVTTKDNVGLVLDDEP